LVWAPIAVAAAVLIWHSLQYHFVTDDAYITFVYSRNLAEHGELTFNLGDRVEGYTSFLWTVVLAVPMLVGIAPEVSSLVLGTACGIATLFVVFRLMTRVGLEAPWSYLPSFLLALSSGYACWSSGGMETQLFTLLVVAAIDAYVAGGRALRRMGVLLALAAMTRPEGLLVTGVIGLHRIAANLIGERRWKPSLDEVIAVASFAAIWAPWFLWRRLYYGHWFPNTYYVKATGAWMAMDRKTPAPHLADEMIRHGAYYLKAWLDQTRLLWALPVAAVGVIAGALQPPKPRRILVTVGAAIAAAYLVYTVTVGGDFMGLHRFIMPVFAIAAIAVAIGFDRIVALIRRPIPIAASYAVAGLVAAGFGFTQYRLTVESLRWGNFAADHGVIDTPAFLIAYTEDRAAIGRHMASCFSPDDFSIVGGAGAQPYFGRMRGIDVFGLVSDRIAHDEPRTRARAGHTKWGRDELLATYEPDFVFSCYRLHADPKPPPLPCDVGFWKRRGFTEATIHIPALRKEGDYYTFLVKSERNFDCPGLVKP
jgi:hypothetical protein